MDNAMHRHDITDRAWEIIAPHLPGKKGDWGGVAKDNRRFINAVVLLCRQVSRKAMFFVGMDVGKMENSKVICLK